MKRFFLKILPFFVSLLTGILLYILSLYQKENLSDLFLNLSAAFIAIPLLYIIYELSKSYSRRRLNEELFDYSKMRIDKSILSLVSQIIKLIYPYGYQRTSLKNINDFLSISFENLQKQLSKNKIIGFQVFKDFSEVKKNIEKILESPFVLNRLTDEQTISLIELLKSIRSIESVITNVDNLYIVTDEKSNYETYVGSNLSQHNKDYPDRYMLMEKKSDKEFKVIDFADIIPFKTSYVLNVCKMNDKYLGPFSNEIFDVLAAVNKWLSLTNNEFIVDTKHFKFSYKDDKWIFR